MRDLIVSLIVVGSLPACFRRPLIGLLMFSVLAYMRLQDLAWGFARYQRWSYIVAMVTFAGYFAARDRKSPVFEARIVLMIFLTLAVGAGLIGAEGEIPVMLLAVADNGFDDPVALTQNANRVTLGIGQENVTIRSDRDPFRPR